MNAGGKKSPWWLWLIGLVIPGGIIILLLFKVGKKVYQAEKLNKAIASITTTGVKPGTDPLGAKAAVTEIITDQQAGTLTQAQLDAINEENLLKLETAIHF